MGNRLSKIYTRTGDDGSTGLADGSRVRKDDLRVEALGTLDELNSALGLALACDRPAAVCRARGTTQHRLCDAGGELAIPGSASLGENDVAALEQALDGLNAELPPLREFVLPGGTPAAAHVHLARAICRRAERALFRLAGDGEFVNPHSLRYLNRLSDLLFVAARRAVRDAGAEEVLWEPRPTDTG